MASKLTKEDYNKVLSAEYGFPVFLTDKEYARIQTERPAPEMKHAGYQDPFGQVEHKTEAQKEAARADKWTTMPGVTYNSEHGRTKKTSAPAAKPGPVAAPSKIEKIAMPETPKVAPSWGPALTAETSMPVGKPVAPGWVTPKQDTFGAKDFGIPMTGDPIAVKKGETGIGPYTLDAVPDSLAALPQHYQTPAVAAPVAEGPRWMSEEDEWAKDMAKYDALLAGK